MKKFPIAKKIFGVAVALFLLASVFPVTTNAQVPASMSRTEYIQALDNIMMQLQKIQELLNILIAEEATIKKTPTPVQSIAVVVDYLKNSAEVNITYKSGTKKFLTVKSEQKSEIINILSRQLDMKKSDVEAKSSFTFLNADTPTKLLVTIESSRNISVELTYADDRVIGDVISQTLINNLIASLFFGNVTLYNSVFDSYVTDIKHGIKPTDVISVVASSVGLSASQISNIVEFEVASNYQSGTDS